MQFVCCSSTPWHKLNCPEGRWLGNLLPNSDPNDKSYVGRAGYSTYLLGGRSCEGWCCAALQPPNHTVGDPALRRKRKWNFCFNQYPRKYYLLYILGALLHQASCHLLNIHIRREDNCWLIAFILGSILVDPWSAVQYVFLLKTKIWLL